jgi:putative ABC transport system substrate-binding protein
MSICLRRREFVAALSGAAAWSLAARAQQGDRVRRIGVLMGLDENDPLAKLQLSAFTQALAGLGWADGRNVRLALRWGGGDTDRIRAALKALTADGVRIVMLTGDNRTTASAVARRLGIGRGRLHRIGDGDDPRKACRR